MEDSEDRKNREPQPGEEWLPFITRTVALGVGSFILVWQTVLKDLDRPYLIGGAITLMLGGGVGLFLDNLDRRR
jgi:hypothetical protein